MTYRILPPEPGGRRDRRLRSQARTRATRQVALSVTLVGFAAGTFASENVADLRDAWSGTAGVVEETVAAVEAPEHAIEVVTETVENIIEHGSVQTSDPGERVGSTRVVQEGVPGVEMVSYTVTRVNGFVVDRQPGVTVLVQEPIDEIIAVGALTVPPATEVQKGSNREIGQSLASSLYGWSGDEWACLDALWKRESGWSHTAENRSSGAYGIPQALPGSKMASFGSDWRTNPETQIKWGLSYISGRYGTPCGAWSHSERKGWY